MNHPATLYSTWKQRNADGTAYYIVVTGISFKAGEVISYELLRLFNPEKTKIDVEAFKTLVKKNVLVEWRM